MNCKKILTYGLNGEQTALLASALPDKYDVEKADCATDLMVTDCVCAVVDTAALSDRGLRILVAHYMDLGERLSETVVWIGKGDIPPMPYFVRCDDFLQLLVSGKEIVNNAQRRYDTLAQYTDAYSFLPAHAIADYVEEEIFTALGKMTENYPGFSTEKDLHQEWMGVLEAEKGPMLLAGVNELCRWLKKSKISYRVESICFHLVNWLMDIVGEEDYPRHSDEYRILVAEKDYPMVKKWLDNHWYFCKPDSRLQLQTCEGLEIGIAAIDLQIQGMRPGEVILIGGRPAMGRSSLVMGAAEHIGKTKRVLYLNLEENSCREEKGTMVVTGRFDTAQMETITQKEKPDILIIDRLQRIGEILDGLSYQFVMWKIRKLAQEMQIPILLTTDLLQDVDQRSYPIPCEQDIPAHRLLLPFVDTVVLLYRPAYYDPHLDRSLARAYIKKAARMDSACRIAHMHWNDEKYRFNELL